MQKTKKYFLVIIIFLFYVSGLFAQNIYDLRKLTDRDWLSMSTEERMNALNVSNNHARNQTFFGKFGRDYDRYPGWGYDYYEMEDRYENYAFRGFENFNIIEDRRQRWYYNQFGDRLTKMTRSASIWHETYYDSGASDINGPLESEYINSQLNGMDGIWVARESTDDWALSVVGAGALRTKLSPLTLSIPNVDGVKADFQSNNYQASVVNSVIVTSGTSWGGGTGSDVSKNVLLLRGGQVRRKFGALNLGMTYANMYAVQQTRENGDDLRGNVSDYAPTPIYYALRIIDDSPQDGDGPVIQDVKLRVNGMYRPDINPVVILDNMNNELITAVFSKSQNGYLQTGTTSDAAPDFDNVTVEDRIPKYLDYLYLKDYARGWNTKTMTENYDIENGKKYFQVIDPGINPVRVNGNEYVVYLFDLGSIKDRVDRVEAEVTLANDYRIQISQIYTKKVDGGHDRKGDNIMHYRAEYWKTVAQAEGNIKDGSNLRTVRVSFGQEVGNLMYGFDAHFNYLGFRVNGEFVTNTHYFMYSDGVPGTGLPSEASTELTKREGHRSSISDHAYYVVMQKEWSLFGINGELFKMGKFYRPYINYYNPGDIAGHGINCRNDTIRISMIDDNDDDDQYPDIMFRDRVMASRLVSLEDPDGVYPGNDLDHDGYPDNEKNDNNYPDYDEPFLMFDVDPDEFVFGDDFNNNTIPDFREDDMKYDTPYDLDRKGHNIYTRFSPQKNVNVFLGSLRTHGVGLDNRTYDDYFKTNITYNVFMVGKLFVEYRYERIQDNVQDKYIVNPTKRSYRAGPGHLFSPYDRYLYYDEVEYRNSRVQKFFVESKMRALPALTVENHIRYERNSQLEGTMYDNTFQPEDTISIFAMVNKFVYTRQWKGFTFSPGIKFRLYKKNRFESLNPLDHYLMRIPLVTMKYTISPRTAVTFGMQGFRGFEMKYRDYIQSHNDYKQVDYILQVDNRTTYFGFDIWSGFGFSLEEIKYDEAYRKFEEYKTSTLFVQMWLGY